MAGNAGRPTVGQPPQPQKQLSSAGDVPRGERTVRDRHRRNPGLRLPGLRLISRGGIDRGRSLRRGSRRGNYRRRSWRRGGAGRGSATRHRGRGQFLRLALVKLELLRQVVEIDLEIAGGGIGWGRGRPGPGRAPRDIDVLSTSDKVRGRPARVWRPLDRRGLGRRGELADVGHQFAGQLVTDQPSVGRHLLVFPFENADGQLDIAAALLPGAAGEIRDGRRVNSPGLPPTVQPVALGAEPREQVRGGAGAG